MRRISLSTTCRPSRRAREWAGLSWAGWGSTISHFWHQITLGAAGSLDGGEGGALRWEGGGAGCAPLVVL